MCGVFPITVDVKNGIASSHNGLTYGGLVILPNTEYDQVSEMLNKSLGFLRRNGITEFYYKPIPYIYHKYPSQEDLYWLYVNGSNLYSRSISSVIDLNNSIPFSALRLRKIKKAMESNGLELSVCDASENPQLWKSYWKLLCNILSERHNTSPVHTYEEISYLQHKNSRDIKLYIIFDKYKQEILAGVVAYETDLVMHCQYIASSDVGFKFNALDFLFNWGIKLIAITDGGNGTYVYTRKGVVFEPCFDCQVKDTTGAGDSFWGAFLYKFIEGGLGFDELTPEKVQEYVRFANAAASLCVEKEGAIPALATLEEVLKRLNQR